MTVFEEYHSEKKLCAIKSEYRYALSLDLQLFAKDGPNGEKTEKPTAKKIEDSRKEGQVPKSQSLNTAFGLMGLFVCLKIWVGMIGTNLLQIFPEAYSKFYLATQTSMSTLDWGQMMMEFGIAIAKIVWPFFLVGVAVAFLGNRVQFSWKVTTKPLEPKLSKINPISGFKRLFSVQTLIKTLVSILTIVAVGFVVYSTIKDQWALLYNIYDMEIGQVISLVGDIVINLGIKISAVMIVIGLGDYAFQKWKNTQDMMMSKQDIKDEYKNTEGDPQIKGKIKQKQREMSQRRMMQAVPQADVIITNPTHYAVAVQYDRESQDAPIVIAKGTDYLAGKIKEIAKENGVEIVENRALARMLYNNVEVDQEIPPELYQAVAEVLAYVYKLRRTA